MNTELLQHSSPFLPIRTARHGDLSSWKTPDHSKKHSKSTSRSKICQEEAALGQELSGVKSTCGCAHGGKKSRSSGDNNSQQVSSGLHGIFSAFLVHTLLDVNVCSLTQKCCQGLLLQ